MVVGKDGVPPSCVAPRMVAERERERERESGMVEVSHEDVTYILDSVQCTMA